jgi:hypothetical protein
MSKIMFRDSNFFKIKTNLEFLFFWIQKVIKFGEGSIKQLNGVTKPSSKEVNTFLSLYACFFLSVCCSFSAINNIWKHDTYKQPKRP